jgi:hypothetical protein
MLGDYLVAIQLVASRVALSSIELGLVTFHVPPEDECRTQERIYIRFNVASETLCILG